MKKYILAAITLAAFTGMSFAQAPATPAAAPAKAEKHAAKHEKMKVETFGGEISGIDAAKNEITVKNAKGVEKTFSVEAGKLAALSQGEKVRVTVKGGKTFVKEIKEHKAKHESKKAEAKKPEAKKTEAGK